MITQKLDVLAKNGKRHSIQRWKYFKKNMRSSRPFSKNFNLLHRVIEVMGVIMKSFGEHSIMFARSVTNQWLLWLIIRWYKYIGSTIRVLQVSDFTRDKIIWHVKPKRLVTSPLSNIKVTSKFCLSSWSECSFFHSAKIYEQEPEVIADLHEMNWKIREISRFSEE